MPETLCRHKMRFIGRTHDIDSDGYYDEYHFRCKYCYISCRIHSMYFWGRK